MDQFFLLIIFLLQFVLYPQVFAQEIEISNYKKTITVEGIAEKKALPDLAEWSGRYEIKSDNAKSAMKELKIAQDQVISYFISKGVPKKSIIVYPPIVNVTYSSNIFSKITSFHVSQKFRIRLYDIELLTKIAQEAMELYSSGMHFKSNPVRYYQSKVSLIEQELLADAMKDAIRKAQIIAKSSNSMITGLYSAKTLPFYNNIGKKEFSTSLALIESEPLHYTDVSELYKTIKVKIVASFLITNIKKQDVLNLK